MNYITLRGTVNALNNVNLDVKEGETLAIVGETGSGKSTLGLTVMRILPKNAVIEKGSIVFDGVDLLKLSEDEMREYRWSKISMIFQEPRISLNPVMKIGDQLAEVLEVHLGIQKKRALEKVKSMLKKVGLPDVERILKGYPHELSGGMAQRVMIAMAMLLNPKLVIADEPTSALDVTIQAQIVRLLNDLIREYGSSVIYITHDLALAAEVADRIAVLYAGEIVEIGEVVEIFRNPLHPYTKALLESIPKIGLRDRLKSLKGEVPSLTNPPPGCRFHPRCPYSTDLCSKEEPPFIEVTKGHIVKCHLYRGDL